MALRPIDCSECSECFGLGDRLLSLNVSYINNWLCDPVKGFNLSELQVSSSVTWIIIGPDL